MAFQFQKKYFAFAITGVVLLLSFQNCSKTGFSYSAASLNAQKSQNAGVFIAGPNTPIAGVKTPPVPLTGPDISTSGSGDIAGPKGGPVEPVENGVNAGKPVITATLTPLNAASKLVYSITNLDHLSDSYTIDITNGSSDRSTRIENIVQCNGCLGTEQPDNLRYIIYSNYSQLETNHVYSVLITATNSKGTVTLLLPFKYEAPAVVVAPPPPVVTSCTYTYTPTQVCQPTNTQTVSAVGSPLGCSGIPAATQSCAGPQSNVCAAGQIFSMARQACVSQCQGTEAIQIAEPNMATEQSALIPLAYNILFGYQFIFNGTTYVLGQSGEGLAKTTALNSLGAQMFKSASYSDFVNAFNTSINANPALAGQISASLGGDYTFINFFGTRTTGTEILLKSSGNFSMSPVGFWVRGESPGTSLFGTAVYCKD